MGLWRRLYFAKQNQTNEVIEPISTQATKIDLTIKYDEIKKIGEDVILIEYVMK